MKVTSSLFIALSTILFLPKSNEFSSDARGTRRQETSAENNENYLTGRGRRLLSSSLTRLKRESDATWDCAFNVQPVPAQKQIRVTALRCHYTKLKLEALFSELRNISPKCSCRNTEPCEKVLHSIRSSVVNNSSTFVFTNVTPGNYCLQVQPYLLLGRDVVTTQITLLPFELSVKNIIPVVQDNVQDNVQDYTVLIIIGSVFALLAVFVAVGLLTWRRRRHSRSVLDAISPDDSLDTESIIQKKKVFVIYRSDCEQHSDAVHLFINILESCLSCEVTCETAKDINDVQKNRATFIEQNKNTSDKIIIINSEGAFYWYNYWCNSEIHEKRGNEDIFNEIMNVLSHDFDMRFDYKKIISVNFPYTSSEHALPIFVPGKQYVLPDEMEALFYHIHDIDRRRGKVFFDESGYSKEREQQLTGQIKKTGEYLKEHPTVIKKSFESEYAITYL